MEKGFRGLTVYKKAFELAMDIYEITKEFPAIEKFELIDQIRRSSRAFAVLLAKVTENDNTQNIFPVK